MAQRSRACHQHGLECPEFRSYSRSRCVNININPSLTPTLKLRGARAVEGARPGSVILFSYSFSFQQTSAKRIAKHYILRNKVLCLQCKPGAIVGWASRVVGLRGVVRASEVTLYALCVRKSLSDKKYVLEVEIPVFICH